MNIYSRTSSFLVIWLLYIFFMDTFAPMGTDWISWHLQRVYNFSEYLKINGLFSSYGFSIWSSCENCDLRASSWEGGIYTTHNFLMYLPYIFINYFFNKEGLIIYGPIFDKTIIFLTAIILAEIILQVFTVNKNKLHNYLVALIVFIFFIINPWTYKMIIAQWFLIYFLFFFLLGLYLLIKNKFNSSLISFFLCSLFDHQSGMGLVVLFLIIISIRHLPNKKIKLENNFYILNLNKKKIKLVFCALIIPVIINIFLQYFALLNIDKTLGSSLLYRVGITGSDMHNGGLVGSLQFLAGNRFSQCINNNALNFLNQNNSLDGLIEIYNCTLSLFGMFLISLLSIFGIIILYKKFKEFRFLILPISFLLFSYLALLQQSSSAHLMGYSYFFSIIFSLGIMSIIVNLLKNKQLILSKIVLTIPIIFGIIILCIRVNMLTGVNG